MQTETALRSQLSNLAVEISRAEGKGASLTPGSGWPGDHQPHTHRFTGHTAGRFLHAALWLVVVVNLVRTLERTQQPG